MYAIVYAMQAEVSLAYKSPHSGNPRRVPGFPLNLFVCFWCFAVFFMCFDDFERLIFCVIVGKSFKNWYSQTLHFQENACHGG